MPKDAIPPLPPVPRKVDNESRAFMQAVKDNLQTRAGQTKNRWDYSPTIRELEEAGIITVVGGRGLGAGGPPLIIGPGGNTPFEDITVPEAPTGVVVRATPWYHHITWDFPSEASAWITANGEVWFSETNDRDTALLAGIALNAFSMPVEPLAAYYYWVRYVSYANVNGYWSHGQFDGVYGESPPDPQSLLDTLTGAITESELYQDLNERIDWIDMTDGGLVHRMSGVETTVDENTGEISVIAGDLTQLQTQVDDNYAAIQVNIQSIDGVKAKYTVKTDVNGHIAGFGLINTGNEYTPGIGHSQFGVSADTFWVGAPGQESFAFIVDAVNNRVVMDGAFIVDATITGAAIGDAAIDSAHIGDGTITSAKIENAAIVDAKIADEIRSYALDLSAGKGWRILKSGKIDASEITIYDSTGDIILSSGPTGATYHQDLDNAAQQYAQISNLPDSLETLAFMHASVGGFGNITFDINDHQNGYLQVNGNTFYHPMGNKMTLTSGQYLDTRIGSGRSGPAFFVMMNYYEAGEIWGSWNYGNSTARHFFLTTFNHETRKFSAWDHDGWVADFSADYHSVIVATLRSNGSQIDTATFTTMVGANLKLPDDYATQTGADNLLLDGAFYGSAKQSLSDFWVKSGPVTVHDNSSYGQYIELGDNGSVLPANDDRYVPVIGGELIYFGMTYYIPGGMSNNFVVTAITYDNNKNVQAYPVVIVVDSGSNPTYAWTEASGAYKVPAGIAFISLLCINYNHEACYTGSLKMTRAPTEVSPYNAATYIKNAAIDTLQLAGQAVTFPRYWSITYPPIAHQYWTTALTTGSFTPSAADVPVGVHVSLTLNPANSGVGGPSSSGSFRLMRRGTENMSGNVRIWYTSAASITYPGANNIDLLDSSHGGASVYYTLDIIGEDGEPNDLQHVVIVTYEMKR